MALLVTIGGSGQQLALTVARLVRIKALREVEVRAIDADRESPVYRDLSSFYGTADGVVPHPLLPGGSSGPAGRGVSHLNVMPPYRVSGATSFRACFLSGADDSAGRDLQRDLFELFFDDQDGATTIAKGIYGRPNVGATLLAHTLESGPHYDEVFSRAKLPGPVFVAASFIGGTGAGVTHELIKRLRREVGPERAGDLYGIFLLNWLKPAQGGGQQTINQARLEANMRHGLEYFTAETCGQLRASVLVGPPSSEPGSFGPSDIGQGDGQTEVHSKLLLLAARGLETLPAQGVSNAARGSKGQKLAFAVHADAPEKLLDEEWPLGDGVSLRRRVDNARVVMELLRFASSQREKIQAGFGLLSSAYIKGLHSAIKRCAEREGDTPKKVTETVCTLLGQRATQLERSVRWLDGCFNKKLALPEFLKSTTADSDAKLKTLQQWWGDVADSAQSRHDLPAKLEELLYKRVAALTPARA